MSSSILRTGGDDAQPQTPAPHTATNGGEFLLQLLQNPANRPSGSSRPGHAPTHDPAVARVGPTVQPPPPYWNPPSGHGLPVSSPWQRCPPPSAAPFFAPHDFFARGFPQNPNSILSASTSGFNQNSPWHNPQLGHSSNSKPHLEQNLFFGTLPMGMLSDAGLQKGGLHDKVTRDSDIRMPVHSERTSTTRQAGRLNGFESQFNSSSLQNLYKQECSAVLSFHEQGMHSGGARHCGENDSARAPSMGFANQFRNGGNAGHGNELGYFEHGMDTGKSHHNIVNQRLHVDRSSPSPGSNMHAVPTFDFVKFIDGPSKRESRNTVKGDTRAAQDENQSLEDLHEKLLSSLGIEDGSDEKKDKNRRYGSREKDNRSDERGKWLLGQQKRITKSLEECRSDIRWFDGPFLNIYQSLIPSEEEKAKQEQLMTLLKNIVAKEWPEARLYPYGSCSNTFGFSKSDIDICLAIGDNDINKADILLRLAELLKDEKLQNVQALTHARVPIVKLMDPETGISCDICVNNLLAVENTKLLRDYSRIDARLRQLVFIVKHWAKSRGVNETYRGTLSSYAYVLMCIHLLQQRRPAILPCLQGMKVTYYSAVENVECAYFDKVDELLGFGFGNSESLARLVWAFFAYWAYCHDYANDVISVRTGRILSKRSKDWTRRIGNDRHLICIEDPFEVTHDLGRVVDKFSIRVLREEFERAAEIMQHDPNPCVTLFEPYVPS